MTNKTAVKMVECHAPGVGTSYALSICGVAPRRAVARGDWLAVVAGGAPRDEGERVVQFGGAVGAERGRERTQLSLGEADADARVAAAAAERSVNRRRMPPLLALETVYVSWMSCDVRQHRLRALLADVTGVDVHAFVDVYRFGATTALTLVADAAAEFGAAVGAGRAAEVLRVLKGLDPWPPALLGPAQRRALCGGTRAAEVAAALCHQRLTGTLAQLETRAALPTLVRHTLHVHIQGMFKTHARGAVAAVAPAPAAAARPLGVAARAAAKPAGAVSPPPDSVGPEGGNPAHGSNAGQPATQPTSGRISGGATETATTAMAGAVAADPAAAN